MGGATSTMGVTIKRCGLFVMDDSNAEDVAVDGGSFSVLDVILIAASAAIILLLIRRFTGKKKKDHFPKLRVDPT